MSKEKLRIAMGGLNHETNTFAPTWTEYADFDLIHGEALFNSRLGRQPVYAGVELLPTLVARALPSGLIRKAAYRQLKTELLQELQAALPLNGIYLDLHGAMEIEEIGDAEGDLLAAVRRLVGPEVLISVSLDLHGNISPTLVNNADILTAYRTAPHRDAEETRQRALTLLVRALQEQLQPVSVLIKVPMVLAGEAAVTEREPARSLYARLAEIDQLPGMMNASLLVGCAWTDSVHTPVSVIVVAENDRELAQQQAKLFAREVWTRRHDFSVGVETATIDEAIQHAMAAPERPVFISDSGDNVTAGAPGDVPLFVERLVALGAQEALLAGLADREAVRQCAAAGEGAEVTLSLGAKHDPITSKPFPMTGRVQHLSVGPGEDRDEPTIATIAAEGVQIVLAVDHRPFIDRATIAASGVDPMQQKIVVVKQGYLFPDLADHAPRAIMALSPGATNLSLEELPYRQLPRPIFPLDPELTWEP